MSVKLPAYAKHGGLSGELPLVHVDADAAYTAWLTELQSRYAAQLPGEWYDPKSGDLRPEWAAELEALRGGAWTQYWLEVAYQCIKLELQAAMRSFTFEIRIHDPEKTWAQQKYPPGRGAVQATFGKEARQHFLRARGGLPA
jgi:hypothetical protein